MARIHPEGLLIDGRYRLRSPLGEGGMAIVYDAEDLLLRRPVAVKLVKGVCSEVRAERLFREAIAAARTNHPTVVTVFAYGTDLDLGADYLVMERLEGDSLAERLERAGSLSIPLALRLGTEVADALAAAHAAGVIHRDVKPSNIFLAHRGLLLDDIKLLDFGIAKHLDLHTITRPDQILGTVPYMAPEQLKHPGHADEQTDLYALGVTLFECLSGKHPFEGATAGAIAARILEGRPRPVGELRPDLPPALAPIVERCMNVDRDKRWASAREVCGALQAVH